MKRLLLLMLLLFSGGGWAACTVSTVNASFGSVTSFALSGTGEVETTGRLVVACDTVLNVLTNDSVTLSYTAATVSGNSRATMKRTDNAAITDVIPTRLCGLAGCASSSEEPRQPANETVRLCLPSLPAISKARWAGLSMRSARQPWR